MHGEKLAFSHHRVEYFMHTGRQEGLRRFQAELTDLELARLRVIQRRVATALYDFGEFRCRQPCVASEAARTRWHTTPIATAADPAPCGPAARSVGSSSFRLRTTRAREQSSYTISDCGSRTNGRRNPTVARPAGALRAVANDCEAALKLNLVRAVGLLQRRGATHRRHLLAVPICKSVSRWFVGRRTGHPTAPPAAKNAAPPAAAADAANSAASCTCAGPINLPTMFVLMRASGTRRRPCLY